MRQANEKGANYTRLMLGEKAKEKAPLPGLFGFCHPEERGDEGSLAALGMTTADYNNGTSSKATMLMILISGLMAGPAVSL